MPRTAPVAPYKEYEGSVALLVEPPMNFPWGHCEFLVKDLDGHLLRMSGDRTGRDSGGAVQEEDSMAALHRTLDEGGGMNWCIFCSV